MNWLSYLFNHNKRMADYESQLKEIARQNARVKAAYALHREVLRCYGLAAYSHLTDAEVIIKDTKAITVINYLNV